MRKITLLITVLVFFTQNSTHCQNTMIDRGGELALQADNLSFLSFEPQRTEAAILKLIAQARESIAVSLYGFENESIADAFIEAHHQRGIRVRLSSELDSASSPSWQKLVRFGLPVRFGNAGGIMHNKYIIIDRKYVLTGSTNLTKGLYKNYNHTVILKSPALAREYLQDFEIQFAGYYALKKDEGYDRVIGGLEKQSDTLHWNAQIHNLGASTVQAYFTPYKNSFLEFRSNPGFPPCSETCLASVSKGKGPCIEQNCKELACYQQNSRGRGEIIYAYPNHDAQSRLYCTTYNNAMNRVLAFVRRARSSILILAFAFRDRLLMHELIKAKEEKGLDIKIWIDHRQFRSAYKLSKDSFFSLGQSIDLLKVCRRPDGGLLHHKVIVIDEKDVLLGSLNFSQNAVNANDENFLIIKNAPALARDFYREAARIDQYSYSLNERIF